MMDNINNKELMDNKNPLLHLECMFNILQLKSTNDENKKKNILQDIKCKVDRISLSNKTTINKMIKEEYSI